MDYKNLTDVPNTLQEKMDRYLDCVRNLIGAANNTRKFLELFINTAKVNVDQLNNLISETEMRIKITNVMDITLYGSYNGQSFRLAQDVGHLNDENYTNIDLLMFFAPRLPIIVDKAMSLAHAALEDSIANAIKPFEGDMFEQGLRRVI